MRDESPQGVDLEIIEKRSVSGVATSPNCVRINGVEVLCPEGEIVTVHPVRSDDFVVATVTMFVRRLTMGTEE